MKSLTVTIHTLLLALLFALQVAAIPTSDSFSSSLNLPHPIVSEFIYRDPDTGALIPINGTIEQNLHNFKFDPVIEDDSTSLNGRNLVRAPDCHPPWGWKAVGEAPLKDGIAYLRRIRGDIRSSPRTCGRVSCSWNVGIFLCNDNSVDWWITASKIGDFADNIRKACCQNCMGQQFDDANWNVYVASSPC